MKKIIFLVVFLLGLGAPSAVAHSELVSSNPSASAIIQQLPEQVELEFNEDLLNLGSGNSVTIISPSGEDLGMGETNTDGSKITRLINTTSESGTFKVKYRVVSADGHVVNGNYTFDVNEAAVKTLEKNIPTNAQAGANLLVNTVKAILGAVVVLLIGLAIRSWKRRITSAD